MTTILRSAVAAGFAIAAAGRGTDAAAQTVGLERPAAPAPAEAVESDATEGGLSEIIVTAQKRSQNIQDVPATITALTETELATRQILSIADLPSRVPSLQVGRTYGTNLITLRGISTSATSGFEDPSVAVHVNGVYQSRARSLDVALFDLERIEVLSGPQGTLYGRNATGGVVNYILRGPADTFGGEITGRVGNYKRLGVQGSVSGPIGDKAGFRVSAIWDDQDKGFARNLAPGAPKKRFEESKVMGARGLLRFEPTDTLTLDVEGSYVESEGSFYQNMLGPSKNAGLAAFLAPQSFEPHTVYSLSPMFRDTTEYQVAATATLEISPDAQLKSITAFQDFENDFLLDGDASQRVGIETIQFTNSHTFTQEFNLNVNSFDGRLSSVFGFFYFDDVATVVSDTSIGLSGTISHFTTDNRQVAKSMSFFTDQTFAVLPSLRLIAGLRYNTDQKEALQSSASNGIFACTPRTTKQTFNAWTPRLGFQFDLTPKIMAYATYQEGFKAGGVGANTCANSFAPEDIKGGEAGIKSEFADGRVRLNVAGYWYDYSNIQVQKTLGVAGFAVLNAASAKIEGIEASLNVSLLDNLRLDAAGMVQSAKYTEFQNCDQSAFAGACSASDLRPVATRTVNLKGNWLNRAPEHSLNLGLEYEHRLSSAALTLRAESYFSGKVRYNDFNNPEVTQKSFDIQNFFITFEPEGRTFTARAFVKNAFDKEYLVGGFYYSSTQQFAGVFAAPRTYGADVTFRF